MKTSLLCSAVTVIVASLITSAAFSQVVVPGGAAGITSSTNGSVGIGTTNPLSPLQVGDGTTTSAMTGVAGAIRATSALYSTGISARRDGWAEVGMRAGALGEIGTFTNHDLVLDTNVVERMRITTSGNVGIGTASPSAKLEINLGSSSGWSGNLKGIRLFSPDGSFWMDVNTYIVGAGNVGYQFSPNGNTGMVITTLGNVGIGTATPAAKLDLLHSSPYGQFGSAIALKLRNSDTATYNASQIAVYDSSDNLTGGFTFRHLAHGATGSSDFGLFLRLNGTIVQPLAIGPSGNVGIGTTNPTNKLEVNGTIRAKEVIVETTGWSDYVFAPDYRLAPLSEVEAAIKAEGHLPGIPSAAEVAETGVSVGDMQAKLLAKMEEMTLHQIAQEKRLDAQAARIAQLEAENNALRNP